MLKEAARLNASLTNDSQIVMATLVFAFYADGLTGDAGTGLTT